MRKKIYICKCKYAPITYSKIFSHYIRWRGKWWTKSYPQPNYHGVLQCPETGLTKNVGNDEYVGVTETLNIPIYKTIELS